MNQFQRDQRAIFTVLQHGHSVAMEQIRLQVGEVPYTDILALIASGEVERVQEHSRAPVMYRVTE